jgi:hypothetical protein
VRLMLQNQLFEVEEGFLVRDSLLTGLHDATTSERGRGTHAFQVF